MRIVTHYDLELFKLLGLFIDTKVQSHPATPSLPYEKNENYFFSLFHHFNNVTYFIIRNFSDYGKNGKYVTSELGIMV